jgi:indole-3-glycerol phosphate synthase
MTILEQIVAHKYKEVKERKSLFPVHLLEKSSHYQRQPVSLKESLLNENLFGIIAEFKRQSPSKGIINEAAQTNDICSAYIAAGASAVSVLTDLKYFGGTSEDLSETRKTIINPVLRKDFIVDEYQIVEARSIGADAILLIAEIHEAGRLKQLHSFAYSLGLEVLIEVHDEKNFSRIPDDAKIVGINSRNLASFEVNQEHMANLVDNIPGNIVRVAESGIKTTSDYINLKNAGFNGFLIGEAFMNSSDPGKSCMTFTNELRQLKALQPDNKKI